MTELTNFTALNPKQLDKSVTRLIKLNTKRLESLLKKSKDKKFSINWDNTAQLLDDWDEELFEDLFSVASHLKSVRDNTELRAAFNKSLPKVWAYTTAQNQNRDLYLLMKRLRSTGDLDEEQQKDLDNYLLTCRLSGIDLPPAKRKKFAELVAEAARLTTKFSENVLDSNDEWKLHIKDDKRLSGLPAAVVAKLRSDAKVIKKSGWLIGLDMPIYHAVMTYADDEQLREEVYRAFAARASATMEDFATYDNRPIIQQILVLRHKTSQMLGYATPADMLMADNMVKSPAKVREFLLDLMNKSLPMARKEAEELISYALKHKKECHPWDVTYYSEKLKQKKFSTDAEKLRAYFPLPRVLEGMFLLAEKLFDVKFEEKTRFNSWHKDVRLFTLTRENKQSKNNGGGGSSGGAGKEIIGYLYCDLYARAQKNSGAWMNENRQRRRLTNGEIQKPVAYLVCNFRDPAKGESLLLHHDVEVLFHELGHCLHHLLTKVSCRGVAGINGVAHDMVELPSQIMENWCWDKKFIKNISAHYETGKPLPSKDLKNLIGAKNFHSALQMVRQLEFSMFDMLVHSKISLAEAQKDANAVQKCYDKLRRKYNPLPQIKDNYFPNAFSHIFAGGYAAGYYAYKWAEIMSADIYAMFEENGIYDKKTSSSLRHNIFERGGVGDALDNFVAVRGRKPESDAFLRHNGIV